MRGGPDPRRGPARPTKQAARARRPYIWCSRMGLPFTSGHILALRRFPASSVGPPFRSVWHRDPSGRWTFFQDVPSVQGCARYFGAAVAEVVAATIEIAWDGPNGGMTPQSPRLPHHLVVVDGGGVRGGGCITSSGGEKSSGSRWWVSTLGNWASSPTPRPCPRRSVRRPEHWWDVVPLEHLSIRLLLSSSRLTSSIPDAGG